MRVNIWWILSRQFSGNSIRSGRMEDIITSIFRAAVDSVKPYELITKNELIKLYKNEKDREILEISQGLKKIKCDVTDKKIHLGENYFK